MKDLKTLTKLLTLFVFVTFLSGCFGPAIVTAENKEHLKQLINEAIEEQGNEADLNHIDVSKVEDMTFMFADSKFNGDISDWDVSKVTNMGDMFYKSKFNGDISKWDVFNVTSMGGMFQKSKFNGDISNWNVYNVRSMYMMFRDSKFNGDISNWYKKPEEYKLF